MCKPIATAICGRGGCRPGGRASRAKRLSAGHTLIRYRTVVRSTGRLESCPRCAQSMSFAVAACSRCGRSRLPCSRTRRAPVSEWPAPDLGSPLARCHLQAARALTDVDGVRLDQAMRRAGVDTTQLGRDDEALSRVGVFVELHIEQGRALVDVGAPVGIGTNIWPHGRWRFSFEGQANHAGTTLLEDRRDPMLPFAAAVLRCPRDRC